jgi:hypothetical protein
MREPLRKDILDVFVRKRVVNDLSLLMELDKIGKAQGFELMGDGRFRHIQQDGQVADAHLAAMQRP